MNIKNVLYNWFGMVGLIAYAFVITPFLVHRLGNNYYGIWTLVTSCIAYFTILDFGIHSSVNRYISKYKGIDDVENISSVYTNALCMYGFIGIVVIAGGMIVYLRLDKIFNIAASDLGLVRRVFSLMVAYTAIQFPLTVYAAIIYAYQRFDLINIISVSELVVRGILIYFLLDTQNGLITLAIILVVLGLLKYGSYMLFSYSIINKLKFDAKFIKMSTIRTMLAYSIITFLAVIAENIIYRTDNIVIGMYLDPKAITMYSIGFMISEYLSNIIGKMNNVLNPIFSDHESRGEYEHIRSLILKTTRYAILVGVPLSFAAFVVGKDFITLWMGKEYEPAYTIMCILVCSRMMTIPVSPMYPLLYGIEKHRLILYTGLIEAVINLSLSIYLVRKIGILGVALGTMAPMIVISILMPYLVCRTIKLSCREWLRDGVLRPLSFSAIFLVAIIIFRFLFKEMTAFRFIALTAGIVGIYFSLIIRFGLNSDEQYRVMSFANRFKVKYL